jgi:hypothetical protein
VAFSLYSQEGMISFRTVHSGVSRGFSVWGCLTLSLLAFAQTPAPQSLTPGTSIEREIAGGQAHSYQIQLAAHQFLQLRYEKRGADVLVELTPPDGQKTMVFDLSTGERGSEEIGYLASSGGMYQLIVRPRWKDAPPGKYELRSAAIRAATEQDRALFEAFSLSSEMASLAEQRKYDEALVIAARSQLAGLLLGGPGRGGPAAYQAQISQFKQRIEQLETELSARSIALRAQLQPITMDAVQAALPAQTALVEFTLWSPVDRQGRPQNRPHYAAYVLTRDGQLR